MAVRVAINGLGRTGRAAFRAAHERGLDIEFVALNDLMGVETLAHLLRHDTVYGPFPGTIEVAGDALVVDGVEIPVFAEADPAALPWAELGVEVAIESTGLFRKRADAMKHLEAGARKVIVSAPAKQPDVTVVLGVNFETDYSAGRAFRHLERVVHDELPRAGREGAARHDRHPPRADDDGARVHERPAARRRAAQGPPARTRGGGEPRADVDGRGEGDRPRDPGARGQAAGLRRPRAGADGLARRPDDRGRAADDGRRGERALRGACGRRCARGHPALQRGAARLERHRQVDRTRRSSTRR